MKRASWNQVHAVLRADSETSYSATFKLSTRYWSIYQILVTARWQRCVTNRSHHLDNVLATMKKDIHPAYREVVFQDISTDFAFLTRSTINTKEKITWTDGKEYPLVKVEVSSHSHPFYTGKQKIVDTAGRVDRFHRKYGLS